MKKQKKIARPLFVVAFTVAAAFFAAINVNEQVRASVSGFFAFTTETPSKGICWLGGAPDVPQTYTQADVGQGYAKVRKGTDFTTGTALKAACTGDDYDALRSLYCAQNPGTHFFKNIAMYGQDDKYILYSMDCGPDCNWYDCSEAPPEASSPAPAAPTWKGACIVRDSYTDLPSYNDPDADDGYAKAGKGTNFASYDAVKAKCTKGDYNALGEKFCAGNPGGSYQMQVATYDQDNNYQSTGCGNFGCAMTQCPEEDDSGNGDEDRRADPADTEDDNTDTAEEDTPPPAGYEEEVRTNTVANKKLPTASYDDEILANIETYKNPFPDTDLKELSGKASAELYRRAVIGGFPDGEFKSDRPVNRAEAAKFLLLTRYGSVDDAGNNGLFPDVLDGEWYTKFVVTAANKGIIKGYPDGFFRPANQVKTAEFLKMLSLTFGLEKNRDYGYSDVPADSWFAPYAGIAQAYDLFPDRASSLLSPEKPLSRGEVAVAIYQYLANR